MAWISSVVGAGLQVAGTVGANLSAGKTRKHIGEIGKLDPTYTQSPYAAQQLGAAQGLYNGRMAGAIDAERNINTNQANTIAAINRGATDSASALSLAGGVQGQTNAAYNQLGQTEAANKLLRFENLEQGYQGMTDEHRALFDDSVRRWQDKLGIEMKRGEIRQQQWGNVSNLGSSISGMGSMGFGAGK